VRRAAGASGVEEGSQGSSVRVALAQDSSVEAAGAGCVEEAETGQAMADDVGGVRGRPGMGQGCPRLGRAATHRGGPGESENGSGSGRRHQGRLGMGRQRWSRVAAESGRAGRRTTRKMIYCNTWDPLLVSAGNSSRYQ
jgi:hypothetical protein